MLANVSFLMRLGSTAAPALRDSLRDENRHVRHVAVAVLGILGIRDAGDEIASVFTEIGEVEEEHEKRYLALLRNVKEGRVFKRDTVVKWHCRNCGYVHEGPEAPEICPACAHEQAHFEVLAENW